MGAEGAAIPAVDLHAAGIEPNIDSIVAVTSTADRPDATVASLIL